MRVSNGANLVKGNEVRSGGFRVGVVERHEAGACCPTARSARELTLKLDKKVGDGPGRLDGRASARARRSASSTSSSTRGHARRRRSSDGDTMPARADRRSRSSSTRSTSMFDEPTRERRAGQPAAASATPSPAAAPTSTARSRTLPRAVRATSSRSMRNLADPRTELRALLQGARRRRAHRRAGLEDQRAACSPTMADTFEAISRDPQALQGRRSPRARRRCDAAIASFRVQRPFLRRPGRVLARTSTRRDRASCAARCPTSTRRSRSARRCSSARSRSTSELAGHARRARATSPRRRRPTRALRGLTATVTTLNPQLRFSART